jgi:hypothetical protein
MARGRKTGGRQAGTPNKVTGAFKTAVLEVFHRKGGADWMETWASSNETEFFKIAARLIPTELAGSVEHKHTLADAIASLPTVEPPR